MRRFSRFVMVGIVNSAWGYLLIFGFMYFLEWHPVASNIAGYGVALATAFLLHRRITFQSSGRPGREFIGFTAVFGMAYAANLGVLFLLVEFGHVNAYLSQIVAGAIYVCTSYLLNRHFVFTAAMRQ